MWAPLNALDTGRVSMFQEGPLLGRSERRKVRRHRNTPRLTSLTDVAHCVGDALPAQAWLTKHETRLFGPVTNIDFAGFGSQRVQLITVRPRMAMERLCEGGRRRKMTNAMAW